MSDSENKQEFYEDFPIDLPVNGSADSGLLKIGIEFGPFEPDNLFRCARLPDGWKLSDREHKKIFVLDDKGRRRAYAIIDGKHSHISPMRRFSYNIDEDNTSVRFYVLDGAILGDKEDQVVFERKCNIPDLIQNQAAHEGQLESHEKARYCEKWLNENYPDWQNFDAYWDEGEYNEEFDKANS